MKIVDGNGRTTPVGVQGELLTRGYSVMQGYWGDLPGDIRGDSRRLDALGRPRDDR